MISINPVITTNAAGTFNISLDGLMQGMAMDDPAIRYQLTGGQLAPTETAPMFGGVPIHEALPPTGALWDPALQNSITRAIAAAGAAGGVTGFSVFNQNHAMINSVSSPVPQADSGMLVNFYRLGSRARIPFAMDPALLLQTAAPGYPVMPSALGFNVINQWVCAVAAIGAGGFALPTSVNVIGYNLGNSMVVVYNATTGFATWNRQGDAILLEI
jgi:hypothetical protein